MSSLGPAVVLLVIAAVAFAGSIRVGILLGRGIDQFIEARHANASADGAPDVAGPIPEPPAMEATTPGGPTSE